MAKTIAICNQKGGLTKTTTTLNLGVGLVWEGMWHTFCMMDLPESRVCIKDIADFFNEIGWDIKETGLRCHRHQQRPPAVRYFFRTRHGCNKCYRIRKTVKI